MKKYPLVDIKPRSSGGTELKLGQLPHHVFIMKLYSKWDRMYHAICSGNIISTTRVLTSSHCFLTNRKRLKHLLEDLKLVGGVLGTFHQETIKHEEQQWRSIQHLYSQKFFRFPAYNLAIAKSAEPFVYNQFVKNIPYASLDQDFNGVCQAIAVKSTKSWARFKLLFSDQFKMMTRDSCETTLLRSCRLYLCTQADSDSMLADSIESEGGGLVCHGTGDPEEVDEKQGVLVGITSLIYVKLPTLHHKVALFRTWIEDATTRTTAVNVELPLFCFLIKFFII